MRAARPETAAFMAPEGKVRRTRSDVGACKERGAEGRKQRLGPVQRACFRGIGSSRSFQNSEAFRGLLSSEAALDIGQAHKKKDNLV